MRVLWINSNPNPNPGGTEAHSIDFINYLEDVEGILLYKAVAKGSYVDRYTSDKNKFYITLKSELSPLNSLKLIRLAISLKPDFVVGNNGNEYINTFLAGKLSGGKVILFRHMLNRLPLFLRKFILPNTYKVIAVSESSKRRLIEDGIPELKVKVIPNFIDEERFSTTWEEKERKKEKLGISKDVRVVSFLGKVTDGKGIYDFLEVAKRLIKSKGRFFFMVIGYGKDLGKVREWVEENRLKEHFLLTGRVDSPEEYLKASDFLLVLSKGEESFGRVVVEGFACRNAVVVYDVENLKFLVEDGKTGFVCKVGDIECVVERLRASGEAVKEIVESGYKEFLSNYTKDIVLSQFIDTLKTRS